MITLKLFKQISCMMSYLRKRIDAFRYAFKGIGTFMEGEAHARIHLLATACVVAAGFICNISRWEWCVVILCIGGVFMAEAVNTAVEKLADKVSRECDPLIGAAKDIAAGAVLLFVIAAVIVGLIVFIPHFFL